MSFYWKASFEHEAAMTPEKPKKFLRLPEIIGPGGRIPVSRSTWYRGIAAGLYPSPVKLGRISAWPESDIDALMERIEQASAAGKSAKATVHRRFNSL